ncbi:hypothetical protein CHS0354_041804 [Potamilus streckersoni]|uniref:Mismatch repair endonuclease PMS2 n=1 Tax=Potamilus streckersoni TaxID=2493646 RepID=A0AAE0T1I0_9BIVA|nr:hypothetical protein CHS0354_041804 [Potamilus streckersoni]
MSEEDNSEEMMQSEEPAAYHPKASSIKAIDKTSVHRICSGQVVLTLATAVKELVENSIDAGATNIDVKLKEYGSEIIEVSDNGAGVEEENFEGLTLKHHTSKLQEFSDLINVETFGFRGEALSSLCALGDMVIVTRHSKNQVGMRLEFDNHGKIINRSPQARQIGTTVTIQNLFYTLPVRHKEFHRNLKKEFAKMVQVLNAYAIVSLGVRLSCTNQTGKGKKTVVLSTNGNISIRENISNLFGPKQVQSLLEFKQTKIGEAICAEFGVPTAEGENSHGLKVEGFVSKCDHGLGRSSTDRQFFFINRRPCDLPKLSKVVNEAYHQYNRHQYPLTALLVTMDKETVDMNVTPDKRQIFMQKEKLLLAIIKASLIALYEPTTSVLRLQQPSILHSDSFTSQDNSLEEPSPFASNTDKKVFSGCSLSRLKRSFSSTFAKEDITTSPRHDQKGDRTTLKQRRLDSFSSKNSTATIFQDSQGSCSSKNKDSLNLPFTDMTETSCSQKSDISSSCNTSVASLAREDNYSSDTNSEDIVDIDANVLNLNSFGSSVFENSYRDLKNADLSRKDSYKNGNQNEDRENNYLEKLDQSVYMQTKNEGEKNCGTTEMTKLDQSHEDDVALQFQVTMVELDKEAKISKRDRSINFSLEKIRSHLQSRDKGPSATEFCRSFRAKISPTDNMSAEEELSKEIKKDMFSKMDILGQFNLGFIIVKLDSDLFIVDQHATDEKYNFEMLQRHTVIQTQKLIHPMALELTSSNEAILIDNLDIFRKNGFDFIIDEDAAVTQRVKLISTPVSKNWNFGKDDIEEMIFMLTDSPGVLCRPSRVRQMFASRACHKSVVIGTALNKGEMKRLICHMGEIEQPWNCPHGRPTMRHLINLNMVPK